MKETEHHQHLAMNIPSLSLASSMAQMKRTIYLISARSTSFQRAHFSIFVPSAANPSLGSKIHVVGAPMAGYVLEFKRNYNPSLEKDDLVFPTGQVQTSDVVDSPSEDPPIDTTPRGRIELAATHIAPPGISQDFMAPVNDTTNRRCQEWTIDFVRHLASQGLINEEAIEIVQSKRGPPSHGIGLRPALRS